MPLTAVGTDDVAGSTTKCATVTMMLAERIVRHDWSVDEEHLVGTNAMNVWQTLEFLAGVNERKRYHYEGYNDTNNVVRTLTPCWRRDSFAEKNAKGEEITGNTKFPAESRKTGHDAADNDGVVVQRPVSEKNGLVDNSQEAQNYQTPGYAENGRQKSTLNRKKRAVKSKLDAVELDEEFHMSPLEYTDLVKCK